MGKASRDKGNRFEREIVSTFRDSGFDCSRVPLSGAAQGDFSDDIILKLSTGELRGEAKARANGFKQIYDWLKTGCLLFIKADRRQTLVVLELSKFIELVGGNKVNNPALTTSKVQVIEPNQSTAHKELIATANRLAEDSREIEDRLSKLGVLVRVGHPPVRLPPRQSNQDELPGSIHPC